MESTLKNNEPTKTIRVSAGTRVYYFDAYIDRAGQPYIVITETPAGRMAGKRKRQRIFLHQEDVDNFRSALAEITAHTKRQ